MMSISERIWIYPQIAFQVIYTNILFNKISLFRHKIVLGKKISDQSFHGTLILSNISGGDSYGGTFYYFGDCKYYGTWILHRIYYCESIAAGFTARQFFYSNFYH